MYCIILKCATSNKMGFFYYKDHLASYKDGINMVFEHFSLEN